MVAQVPAAEDCPDSVFIEDTVVVCEDLAVLAARARWPAGPRWPASPRSSGRWACAPPGSTSQPLSTAATCNLGFTPVVADISEFEKLEGCVICLSVLLPRR